MIRKEVVEKKLFLPWITELQYVLLSWKEAVSVQFMIMQYEKLANLPNDETTYYSILLITTLFPKLWMSSRLLVFLIKPAAQNWT